MRKQFTRSLDSLDAIFSFIDKFVHSRKIDPALVFTLNLVVEELFTNMVKYGNHSTSKIEIELNKSLKTLTITLTDFDVEPFDLTKKGDLDVDQLLEQRKVGGLGIHLVKKMMDDIQYSYQNRSSKITLTKNLGP